MTEVNAGFEQLLHGDLGHFSNSLFWFKSSAPIISARPQVLVENHPEQILKRAY
jgi:hypothetical protein